MNGYKGDHTYDHSCESDSDVSEAGCLPLRHPGKGPFADGPWQQTPLLLRPSSASCEASAGVFTNGLFSPDVNVQNLVQPGSPPQLAHSVCCSVIDHCADMQPSASEAAELLATLQERIAVLEAQFSSQKEPTAGEHRATPSARLPYATDAFHLVEKLDRSLQEIQQACHSEPAVDGSKISARVVGLRRLLHERAEQGRTASAAAPPDAGDAIRLRAELAQLANRLTGEMAEVREFVTSETSDICAFVEERVAEALQRTAVHASQPRHPAQQQLQLGSGPVQQADGPLTASMLQVSASAAALWSPTSSGRSSMPDASAAAELPRPMQDLWRYMQKGMQRLEGLRQHMEEHLAAVRTLCGFADDRIADINRLHDRFEERIEDLHACHRDLERKLARLHSEQARSAGQVQALSAVASHHVPQQLPAATSPASSAGSNGDSSVATSSPACLQGATEATTTQPAAASTLQMLLNVGVLALVAAMLLGVAYNNEPHLVAT